MIGETLSHYRILEKLGEGGMGEVYLAEDTRLKRKVALKVLPPEMAGDQSRLERFQREAEVVAAMDHPNIVTIFSVEEADGVHFLTMSYIEGKSLGELIPEGGMDVDQLFEITVPLADALSAAHEKGITHRDLKPANIMVTTEGRVKVLDFGLAKLQEDAVPTGEDEPTQALTREGLVVGTVPYMSPEQVQGDAVDHRTDIFSLGVLIYEMATGDRPFRGQNSAQLVSSILRDDPPSVAERKAELPFHLSRIVKHCLEKDPKRRYQSALDLSNELEGLQSEVTSGHMRPASSSTMIAAQPVAGRPKWLVPVAAAAGLVLLILGWLAVGRGGEEAASVAGSATEPAVAASSRSSVAVLYFDNLTGDQELDWLRTGLTDMLVTDLSQLSAIKVVGTDRIYQILKDLGMLEEPITSADVVRQVAEQASAQTVLLGSFAKAGETLRISVKVQDAISGEILSTNRVEGLAGDNLFAMVDELTGEIRQGFDTGEAITIGGDRELMNVTTASLEAYRHYAEGVHLGDQGRAEEATEQLRKAVDIDPGFAMALRKLSIVLGNQGEQAESQGFARRAVESADRLPLREKYLIQAAYYTDRPGTVVQGIEAYEKLLEIEPDNTTALNNLGLQYMGFELLERAVPLFEKALEIGTAFGGTYANLALAYGTLGRLGEAEQRLDELAAKDPDGPNVLWARSLMELGWGDPSRALEYCRKLDEVAPGMFVTRRRAVDARILLEDWQGARGEADKLAGAESPLIRRVGLESLADLEWYEGRPAEALELMRQRVEEYPEEDASLAGIEAAYGFDLLTIGRAQEAVEIFHRAAETGRDDWVEIEALSGLVEAQADLGRFAAAREALSRHHELTVLLPGPWVERDDRYLRGAIVLAEGDGSAAVEELEAAKSLLSPNGGSLEIAVDVHYDLARAYIANGKSQKARQELESVLEAGVIRIERPVRYVRSLYLLGEIAEAQGDREQARGFYQRFLDHWGDGDMDRERVEHARRFISSS